MHTRAFVLLAALSLRLDGAGDGALDRATLRGVAAVNVVIDPVSPEIDKTGATAAALQARLEERLRDGGITINTASNEFAGLRLTAVRGARGPFALAATLGLYQPVILARDPNLKTATNTWEVQTLVLTDAKQLYQACMESVDELAGRLVAAYREVNPASKAGIRADPRKASAP